MSGVEVADIFQKYGQTFRQKNRLWIGQLKAMQDIEQCRTAALGGHIDQCDQCGHSRISYNSCRNRHCPKCQSMAKERWLEARKADLLPVNYFHLVFTLPQELYGICLANPRLAYSCLFKAAGQTVMELAADPKLLGAKTGLISVLHTWGQNLMYHPHLHCIVPGGGLSADGNQWVHSRKSYFLPVQVLSALFRGKFLALLKAAFRNGELRFSQSIQHLSSPRQFNLLLSPLYEKGWVVYAKEPFGGPEQVIEYLGRYTHRIAISNHRILSEKEGKVRFKWRDYRNNGKNKVMELEAEEFIRRFLLHVLPSGFMKIRYYGLMANRSRKVNLKQSRKSLGILPLKPEEAPRPKRDWKELLFELTGVDPMQCPCCQEGKMAPAAPLPSIRDPPVKGDA